MKEITKEIWKDIKFKDNGIKYDYSGEYQISNLGRIKYLPKKAGFCQRKEKITIGYPDKDGYLRAYLCKNGKTKTFGVHKLVALMFIPNPLKYTQINHKDEVKNNNNVNNLEWCSCKYNINYGSRTLRAVFTRKENRKCEK